MGRPRKIKTETPSGEVQELDFADQVLTIKSLFPSASYRVGDQVFDSNGKLLGTVDDTDLSESEPETEEEAAAETAESVAQ